MRLKLIAIFLLFATSLAICSVTSNAQWKHCIGPGNSRALCCASIGGSLYVGTQGGLFRSTDRGNSWGIVNPELSSYEIRSLAVDGDMLFVLVGNVDLSLGSHFHNSLYGHEGLYRVSGTGEWTKIDQALPLDSLDAISVCNSVLYCWTATRGLKQSTDHGDHWYSVPMSYQSFRMLSSDQSGRIVLAAANSGPSLSLDSGRTWHELALPKIQVDWEYPTALYVLDSTLYLGFMGDNSGNVGDAHLFITSLRDAELSISLSSSGGGSWQNIDVGGAAEQFFHIGSIVYAIFDASSLTEPRPWISRSTNNGKTWNSVSNLELVAPLSGVLIAGCAQDSDIYVVGSTFGFQRAAVFRSSNLGVTWQSTSRSLRARVCKSVCTIGNVILAGTEEGIIRSTDAGQSWQATGDGFRGLFTDALFPSSSGVFAATDSGTFISFDSGTTWKDIGHGIDARSIYTFAEINGHVFAGMYGENQNGVAFGKIFVTTDQGNNWQECGHVGPIGSLVARGDTLFAAGPGFWGGNPWGPSFSTDLGTTWFPQAHNIGYVAGLTLTTTDLFAAEYATYHPSPTAYYDSSRIWRSQDGGRSWINVTSNFHGTHVLTLASDGSNLFAGTIDSAVSISSNSGASWTMLARGLDSGYFSGYNNWNTFYGFAITDGTLFAAGETGVWSLQISDVVASSAVRAISTVGGTVVAYPNPFSGSTKILFTTTVPNQAQLDIIDALGQKVATLYSGRVEGGEHSFEWNAGDRAPGVYFCVVRSGSKTTKIPIVITR